MAGPIVLVCVLMLGTLAPSACSAAPEPMAVPPEVQLELPGARLQGQARLHFLGLPVYDIRLWSATPLGERDALQRPAALEIEYARPLQGQRIAERSLLEMRRLAGIADVDAQRWLAQMSRLFPDVRKGHRIIGVHRPGEGARFHVNGRWVGEVREAEFAQLFFGIWLAPGTSQPQMRAALLGLGR